MSLLLVTATCKTFRAPAIAADESDTVKLATLGSFCAVTALTTVIPVTNVVKLTNLAVNTLVYCVDVSVATHPPGTKESVQVIEPAPNKLALVYRTLEELLNAAWILAQVSETVFNPVVALKVAIEVYVAMA